MEFLEIVLTVCSLGNANICEDQRVIVDSSVSLEKCAMQAEPMMAQWAVEHPNWTVTRWHCEYSGRQQRKT
ncbi:MAG: hypothetical protein JOY97_02405 [Hyphomicrobiales bacterium]|nr:hypothetical protein [Hyphomicrobiales bacterium]